LLHGTDVEVRHPRVESRVQPGHRPRQARGTPGPVVITNRGRPSHVLLTFEEYNGLASRGLNVIDLLGMPAGIEDAALEMPDLRDPARPADLR
jgi:prevent-host-death family protein